MSVAFAPLRLVAPARPLRVVDVALFYGERSGGIRTYLDAKTAHARESGRFGAPPRRARPPGAPQRRGRSLASRAAFAARGRGQRLPGAARRRRAEGDGLRLVEPDVVLLHDPFSAPRAAVSAARSVGRAGRDGPPRVARPRRRRAARARTGCTGPRSARGCGAPTARSTPSCPPATRSATPGARRRCRCASGSTRRSSRPAMPERGDHVLYAGRLSREKGVFELLEAAARSASRGRCG